MGELGLRNGGSTDWEVLVLGPKAAAVKGTGRLTRADSTGSVRTQITDWAEVWILEEGVWKILVAKEAWEWIDD